MSNELASLAVELAVVRQPALAAHCADHIQPGSLTPQAEAVLTLALQAPALGKSCGLPAVAAALLPEDELAVLRRIFWLSQWPDSERGLLPSLSEALQQLHRTPAANSGVHEECEPVRARSHAALAGTRATGQAGLQEVLNATSHAVLAAVVAGGQT